MMERATDCRCHACQGAGFGRTSRRSEDVADEGFAGGQHGQRKLLHRVLARDQALPRLRAAVARMVDRTPIEPPRPMPGLPLTCKELQA